MNKKIVLISCVKSKMNKPAKAKDLYISPLFKLNFKYAKSLNPSNIFVLSAKYDLVDMNQIISPYEKTLNKMKKIERQQWAECVIQKLKAQYHLGNIEIVFLAGIKYREYLIPHFKNYSIPLKGLPFGKQLQKLKELTK
jgi:hypothetical protein